VAAAGKVKPSVVSDGGNDSRDGRSQTKKFCFLLEKKPAPNKKLDRVGWFNLFVRVHSFSVFLTRVMCFSLKKII